ncbi:uncharacterized protein LOC143298082 [Babylonia areolata]|uniref:uncharacterized protein LOC143298082 n=1 Tax=Babylonia areolata TaxID=304850 RepID=UPI003FD344AC
MFRTHHGLPLTLLATLLTTTTTTGLQEDGSCVLPATDPATLFGPTPGSPPQLITKVSTRNYSSCLSQCCLNSGGLCNVLVFTPQPEESTELNCALFLCEQLWDCNISVKQGDQIYADKEAVLQALAEVFSNSNGEESEQGSTTETPPSVDRGDSSHGSAPEEVNSTTSVTPTPQADSGSTGPRAQEGAQEPPQNDSNTTNSTESQTNVTNDESPGTPGSGTEESLPDSDGGNGTTASIPASTTSGRGPSDSEGNSSSGSTEAGGSENNDSTGEQSGTEQSETSDNNTHTDYTTTPSANTTTSLQKSLNDSDAASSLNTSSVVTPTGESSNSSQSSSQPTTPHASDDGSPPSSNSTAAPDHVPGSTLRPSDSTPTANTTPALSTVAQNGAKPTTGSGSSGHQKATDLPHTNGSSATTTAPQEEGEGAEGSWANSSTTSPSSMVDGVVPDIDTDSPDGQHTGAVPGEAVLSGTDPEDTPPPDTDTAAVDASLDQDLPREGGNRTNSASGMVTKQAFTTMVVLITTLTLGCLFFLVTLVLAGKRLVDCWRNRKYSKINRDYLIDGMYDE